MDNIYELIRRIFNSTRFFKIVIVTGILLGFYGLSTGLRTDSETESIGEIKTRHSLVIYEIKKLPKDGRFTYEYYTDAQIIFSSKKYSIGDTISFTTRKEKRQDSKRKAEIISLKAELSQRDENWKTIQVDINKILLQYN